MAVFQNFVREYRVLDGSGRLLIELPKEQITKKDQIGRAHV